MSSRYHLSLNHKVKSPSFVLWTHIWHEVDGITMTSEPSFFEWLPAYFSGSWHGAHICWCGRLHFCVWVSVCVCVHMRVWVRCWVQMRLNPSPPSFLSLPLNPEHISLLEELANELQESTWARLPALESQTRLLSGVDYLNSGLLC